MANLSTSLINTGGFAIGIATVLFLALFIRHEVSYDNFYPDANRIYRLLSIHHDKDYSYSSGFSYYPTALEMSNEIPGISDFCRVTPSFSFTVSVNGDFREIRKLRFADENIFTFFDIDLISGNPATAIDVPGKIVLSESQALKLFGDANPLGETISYAGRLLTVSAIAQDMPANTHLGFDAIVSNRFMELDKESFFLGWGGGVTLLSYLKLEHKVTPESIEACFNDFYDRKINIKWEESGFSMAGALQNIRKVHFTTGQNHYDNSDSRSLNTIIIISGIATLILLLAVFNYINLYTSQNINRAKTFALMKIHGAKKRTIDIHLFTEILIISLISMLIAILLLSAAIPFLNQYLHTSVSLSDNRTVLLLFIVLIILFLSVLITILSSFRNRTVSVTEAVHGTKRVTPQSNLLTNVLVTFQFVVVIGLIIVSLFITKQHKYLLNRDLGFDSENILSMKIGNPLQGKELSHFINELEKMPDIVSVSLTSQPIGMGLTQNGYLLEGHQQNTMLHVVYTDANFSDCFNIELVSGRFFRDDGSRDRFSVVINQKLANIAGWEEPLGKRISRNGVESVIIGMVKDFNFAPLVTDVSPLIILSDPSLERWGYNVVNIKYSSTDVQRLIDKIGDTWKRDYTIIPYEIGFLDNSLAQNYAILTSNQRIIDFFSILAIVIACMGLFGYTMIISTGRIKEIGIRKVNGAKVWEVMVLLNFDFVKWVAIAFIIAAPITWYIIDKLLQNFAYRTELSWWVFALAGLMALAVALLTVSWQSWQAARRNPVEALRYE